MRAGGSLPKQFQDLCRRPMLWWSVDAFLREDPSTTVILVVNADFISLWEEMVARLPESERHAALCCSGGSTRCESVANGLRLVAEADSLVAVHDAARPMVTVDMIRRGWESARLHGATVPVVPVVDTLRHLDGAEGESHVVDRSEYVAVQTPQVFRADILRSAYSQAMQPTFTDDASVVEVYGGKVALYEGDPANIKVTNPLDFIIAAALISQKNK